MIMITVLVRIDELGRQVDVVYPDGASWVVDGRVVLIMDNARNHIGAYSLHNIVGVHSGDLEVRKEQK